MMKRTSWMSALVALGTLSISGVAAASSHREAPAISRDPSADNTDLYAWVEGSNLVIVANYIPLEEPAGGPNFNSFADDVLYEVHLARGNSSLDDAITYQIKFATTGLSYVDPADMTKMVGGGKEFFSQISGAKQTYTVTKIDKSGPKTLGGPFNVAPPNIGPRTNALAYAIPASTSYEAFFVDNAPTSVIGSLGGSEGRVFAGPREDAFVVDLGAIFDLAGLRILPSIATYPNQFYPASVKAPLDNVAGYNTHTIALEIPLQTANAGNPIAMGTPSDSQTVGVWASASRRKVTVIRKKEDADSFGPWVQVSRLGLPLINEAVIGIYDKDRWNRLRPKDDVTVFGAYFLNPVLVRDAEFAGLYDGTNMDGVLKGVAANLPMLKTGRTDIIDVINLKNIPTMGAHNIPLTATGDVLRVDLGVPSGFPNGRVLAKGTNHEGADVVAVELSLILTGDPTAGVDDGVTNNDTMLRNTFPFLATPWEGFASVPHAQHPPQP